jgi:hypothetical protein
MNSSPISSLNSSAWIAIRRSHLAWQSAARAELVEAAGLAGESANIELPTAAATS